MAKRKKRNRGGGVPFNPDVDTGTKRPVTARVAVGDVNDKFSDYPSNGLTPRRLARIFREADEGNVRAQMELFEEMEEKDTHLFSQMQTRKLAVTGLDWEVQPFSEDEIDKEIADFIDEQLKGIENFDEVLIDMLDAIGKGISIMELAWTVEDGRNVIEDIEYVHPKKLVWDSTTDELKVCTREYPSGVELPENKFVVHKYKASALTSKAASVRKEKESKTTTTKETYTSERWGKEGGTTIHQISFTVDISKIKDLPLLYKLIDELKDAQNRTDSPTPATT